MNNYNEYNNNEKLKYCKNYQNVAKRHEANNKLEKMVPIGFIYAGLP